MDISETKRQDLRKEYEEYLREESLKGLSASKEDISKKRLQEEYEEYIKNDLGEEAFNELQRAKEKVRFPKMKTVAISLSSVFLLIVVYASFIFIRVHFTSNRISGNSYSLGQNIKSTALSIIPSQRKKLSGEEVGRVNILLLGAAGEKNAGRNLTDTVMIVSIDTQDKKIAMLSLPRDMYVKIPGTKTFTKINGLYQYGLRNDIGTEAVRKSVEEITGLDINYHLLVDYEGFVKFIDALGGINVDVERDIFDSRYPGPNYSYETFELKKGFQKLDGQTALKYVRERHDDPQGDFGRAKRQQQVMQSAKNKAFSIKTILNPVKINEILSDLEKNIKTDLALDDIESLVVLSKELDTQNISTKVVDAWKKDSLLKVSHVFNGEIRAFILVPRAGNYSQIRDLAKEIFNLAQTEKRKSEMEKENAKILIINASGEKGLPKKIRDLLSESMKIRNIEISNQAQRQDHEKTRVFDLTGKMKIFTLDEIIKSIPATLAQDETYKDFKNYDFVLVLGKDIINPYRFDEDDVEQFKNAQDNQEYFEISE